ncbi:alpha/beta-hydrolase [Agrocybe pediades]|nr:alpha/beta-hydrolase [Agrocybe pediades]
MKVDQHLLITLTTLAFTAPLAAGAATRSSSDGATSSANATTPVVDLGYAKYQGTIVKDSVTGSTNSQFLGIRFAAPPTGALRFSAPALPSPTPSVQLADTQPPICFQTNPWGLSNTSPFLQQNGTSSRLPVVDDGKGSLDPRFSEDCLFLNVVTPGRIGEKRNLPVVVWIHGGGYATGSAYGSVRFGAFYDGNDLVRESGGEVVAIILQYRLGAFGFLAGEKVKKGGALNAGLLDQQFALKWVQNHISKFGGDPRKVTIWGESAGAGSVMQHVIANGGKTKPSLFRAAITSSAYLPSQYKYNSRIPEVSQIDRTYDLVLLLRV